MIKAKESYLCFAFDLLDVSVTVLRLVLQTAKDGRDGPGATTIPAIRHKVSHGRALAKERAYVLPSPVPKRVPILADNP